VFVVVFLADVGLAIQILVLIVIGVGMGFKFLGKIRLHGMVMFGGWLVHVIGVGVVMVPSFLAYFGGGSIDLGDPWQAITIVHGVLGAVVLVLGAWLVGAWHFSRDATGCFKRKKYMIATATLWILLIALGVLLYLRISQII
jgi:hypothetical protein